MGERELMIETQAPSTSWWQQAITAATGSAATILCQRLFRMGRRRQVPPNNDAVIAELQQVRKHLKAQDERFDQLDQFVRGTLQGMDDRIGAIEKRALRASAGD